MHEQAQIMNSLSRTQEYWGYVIPKLISAIMWV